MKRLAFIFAALLSIGAHAASPAATVNGVAISRATVDSAVASALDQGADASENLRQQVRDRLIAEELLWQQAKAAGLDDATAATDAMATAPRQAAIARLIAQRVRPVEPTEQALRARYADVVSRLGSDEYRLSLIQATDAARVQLAAQRLKQGDEFAQVARALSEAPSAARGGELDWISFRQPARAGQTNGLPIELAQATSALRIGQISPPIDLGDSWAIIRLDAKRQTLVPDFDAVREPLRQAFLTQAIQAETKAFIVELLRGATIQVND